MPDLARLPLTAEAVFPALRGGRVYFDVSELPKGVSVRVSVQIYTDDAPADQQLIRTDPPKDAA